MTKDQLYPFMPSKKLAVAASVSPLLVPEAALVGIAVTQDLKIVFDTVSHSRKFFNLQKNPCIALVIGWDEEQTLQYEGILNNPKGEELALLMASYFKVFPEGRNRRDEMQHIAYCCVSP